MSRISRMSRMSRTAWLRVAGAGAAVAVLYGLPYVGQERGAAFVRTMLGRRGWFARVIRGGVLRVGMGIEGPLDPSLRSG